MLKTWNLILEWCNVGSFKKIQMSASKFPDVSAFSYGNTDFLLKWRRNLDESVSKICLRFLDLFFGFFESWKVDKYGNCWFVQGSDDLSVANIASLFTAMTSSLGIYKSRSSFMSVSFLVLDLWQFCTLRDLTINMEIEIKLLWIVQRKRLGSTVLWVCMKETKLKNICPVKLYLIALFDNPEILTEEKVFQTFHVSVESNASNKFISTVRESRGSVDLGSG